MAASVDYEMVACTMEEVAKMMSMQEGRPVTVGECRKLECQALRKLRAVLRDKGIEPEDIIPELGRRVRQ